MKTAVVFYSLDGNCAFVAKELIALLDADLIRLHTADEKQRKGLTKGIWGFKLMFSKKNPPLKPYSFNPAAYDMVIIGAPVWAASPAPPVRTFLSEAEITGKKIALFVTHAGGKGKALEKFREMLAGNTIIAEADFNGPAKNSEDAKRQIGDWVKGFN
ncbi:MAG: flavodoxin [Treponema sp.]|nr:flavodoxin [Treponema sp.]